MTYGDGLFAAYYAQHSSTPYVPRLPSDYQEAEYLWTDATNTYIDTGLKITADDVIECRVMFTGPSNTNTAFVGDGNSKTDSNFAIWLAPDSSSATYNAEFSFGDGNSSTYKVVVPKNTLDVTQWHTYKAEAGTGKAYVDGELVGQASVKGYANAKKLVLFGSWRGSNTNSLFIGRMGECRIWRNGELIKHFVPALYKVYQEAGFCDMCTGWFRYGNVHSKIHLGPCPLDELAELVVEVTPTSGNLTVSFKRLEFVTSSAQYVDWGDGTVESTVGGNPLSHTYAQPGTYVVRLQSLAACSHIECNGLAAPRVLRLSPGTTVVPQKMFYNCADVTMSDSVFDASGCITIGTDAFRNASSLALTRLPRTLGFIGSMAFQQTAVTISTIPSTVERIYSGAFKGCMDITSITFEAVPQLLESDVFASCANLTDIYVPWDSSDAINANAPWGATNAVVHYNQTT